MSGRWTRIGIWIGLALLVGCGTSPEPGGTPAQPEAPLMSSPLRKEQPADPSADVAIPNARMPMPQVLTGGQPTEAQIREAAGQGYRTLVNLRPHDEAEAWDETALAAELGLRYVNIPVHGADDLTEENVRKLASVLDDPAARPMIVHCASGNRVGALLALKAAMIDGADMQQAIDVGRRAGLTRLMSATARKIQEYGAENP